MTALVAEWIRIFTVQNIKKIQQFQYGGLRVALKHRLRSWQLAYSNLLIRLYPPILVEYVYCTMINITSVWLLS